MKIKKKTFYLILGVLIFGVILSVAKDLVRDSSYLLSFIESIGSKYSTDFPLNGLMKVSTAFGLRMTKKAEHSSHQHAKDIYYCPMHPTYTSDRPGNCPICGMKLVKRTLPEVNSSGHENHGGNSASVKSFTLKELMAMKPGEICLLHKCKMGNCMMVMTEEMAKLGKCPHCGEDLGVVVKDLAPAGYGGVQLTPEKQRIIGIKTAVAQKKHVTKTIRTAGKIAHDPELYQAEEEYLQAIGAYQKAKSGDIPEITEQAGKLVESSKVKLHIFGINEDLMAEIQKAGAPDRSLLYGEPGGTVWLYAPIYEYEIPVVKVGDKVEVEVPAIPGRKFQGTLRSIDPVLDPMTRSVRVRAILENPEGIFKPEMYVNTVLQIDFGDVLVIPAESVFSTGEKNIVFVAQPDGVFEPREVVLGTKTETDYEIKSGIAEGEAVVTSGNFLIDSESRLKAALEGIGEAEHSVHQHG